MGTEVFLADGLETIVAWVFTLGVAVGALVVGPNVLRFFDWLAERRESSWSR